ncbi:DUF58 domain-containing protein [Proteiniborus sp. MB09-C3]|uniref:DUF58 domain-containing protein n=1 Tax=Proteiniborus sp. MB09-C3 TaxID=3050072 RepID=UPI00255583CB|nr:DUF58 domain-containing protein [Proteiniborus sp. MB09-C3]WIV13091.1 DUF58 domain-containing protein [Proteiniborus sp. MB09-C3]
MTITKRFILLIGLGIILTFIAYFFGLALTTFILYNIICFSLLIIDYMISPSPDSFEIERLNGEKLSLFENEKIGISVYNKSDKKIYAEIKDEVPDFHFDIQNSAIDKYIAPHGKEVFEYEIVPKKRGAFKFGKLHMRYDGQLKLCRKQFSSNIEKEYKVYPNLKDLRKHKLAAYNSLIYKDGRKRLRILGKGTEFESLREYVSGDEYRKINWNATARENKPIVNQYEPEKNQHVYVLIDAGRPMSYSIRGHSKLDIAINTGLILCDIVNQNGDQSGLMAFNTDIEAFIPPGKGSGHRNRLMEALYHIEHSKSTSNYEEAFYFFKEKERRRSLICLFTDFDTIEEAEDMIRVLPAILKNNIVIIVLINDEKLEKIVSKTVKKEEEAYIKSIAIEMLKDRKKLISLLNTKGIMCIECEPEKITSDVINKYIYAKNRMHF